MLLSIFGLIGLGFAVSQLILAVAREEVSEPPYAPYVPEPEEIASAESLAELDAYYDYIGELYILGTIDHEEYYGLYLVYQERYYELLEVE